MGKYIDRNPESEWGIVELDQYSVKENKDKRFFVLDNFYSDPHGVREFALQQTYYPGEGAVGHRTRKQFMFDGLRESFEEIIGAKIPDHDNGYGWFDEGINGRFQYCPAGTPSVFHCDVQKWAAMIYLTPGAPSDSGTRMHVHKKTGLSHGTEPDIGNAFAGGFFDSTKFDTVALAGNVFNRLVIMDAKHIHSAGTYFGNSKETGRLVQLFFFD